MSFRFQFIMASTLLLWTVIFLGALAIVQQPTRIMFDPATDGPIAIPVRRSTIGPVVHFQETDFSPDSHILKRKEN